MKTITTTKVEDTKKLAMKLGKACAPGTIICLFGDLGAGKTTFVKGLASGLKVNEDKVNSPTFVFMNEYKGRIPIFHFDLYRCETTEAIVGLGYEEFFFSNGVSVVEWSENLKDLTPKEYIKIKLIHDGENKREIKISALGKKHKKIIKSII